MTGEREKGGGGVKGKPKKTMKKRRDGVGKR